MSRTLGGVLVALMFVAAAATSYAGIPDPGQSGVALTAPLVWTTCPSFDGPTYQYITVTAKRSNSTPIQGIPYNSFFFLVTGGDVSIAHVDAETDVNGEIRFEMTNDETIIALDPDYLVVEAHIYTVVVAQTGSLEVNSYDIDGLGTVGLSDFSMFSIDYGTVAKRSDFDWSGGNVGLADFSLFSQHYGH